MTSSFLENVKTYFVFLVVLRYYILVIPPKKDFDFYSKLIKNLTLKSYMFLFLIHGLSFDILEKKIKNRVSLDLLSSRRAKFNHTTTNFEDNSI